MKMIPQELQEPKELQDAFEAAKQMKWSKEELEAYDALGIFIQDERGRIEYALEEGIRIGEEKGKEEGIRIGEEKGKEEGIKIGEEKGKEEGIRIGEEKGIQKGKIEGKIEGKLETAKELLKMGIEIEKIVKATGLEKEEIEKLTWGG